jgi:hypothetical protein
MRLDAGWGEVDDVALVLAFDLALVLARGDAPGRVRNIKEETFPGSCAAYRLAGARGVA